ncbi:MAG TPA: PilZ domain-containing protein [Dissulfurispiraceae bacterium]|nr:PilZ domain-containing protein [Dissulfurispiraceae bacterium]
MDICLIVAHIGQKSTIALEKLRTLIPALICGTSKSKAANDWEDEAMTGAEKRKQQRVRIRKDVRINNDGSGRGTCISESGMFVLTGQDYQENGKVVISFSFDRELLSMPGIVRHFDADVGFGVMFVNPTDEQRALLRQVIHAEAAAGRHPARANVLLVDDNVIKRKKYAKVLLKSGYTVLEADNDIQAIELLETRPAQAVVFDPFIQNGFHLLRKIRMLPECRTIIPIVLASKAVPEDKKRMYLSAVKDVLLKMTTPPLRLQQIIEKHLPL